MDVRCKRLRFENGPCFAWSTQRDVGQDLRRRTDVPLQQLRCTSDLAGTSPFASIQDAREMTRVEEWVGVTSLWVRVEFTIWRILGLAGSLASKKYFSKPC